jgi:hypothetical protein
MNRDVHVGNVASNLCFGGVRGRPKVEDATLGSGGEGKLVDRVLVLDMFYG